MVHFCWKGAYWVTLVAKRAIVMIRLYLLKHYKRKKKEKNEKNGLTTADIKKKEKRLMYTKTRWFPPYKATQPISTREESGYCPGNGYLVLYKNMDGIYRIFLNNWGWRRQQN
jgi:hypothetical protein